MGASGEPFLALRGWGGGGGGGVSAGFQSCMVHCTIQLQGSLQSLDWNGGMGGMCSTG